MSTTSNRRQNFFALSDHAMIGRWLEKLSESDRQFCLKFIDDNVGLTDSDFIFKVNRMFLGVDDKPKNWSSICDLLSASIPPVQRPRRN